MPEPALPKPLAAGHPKALELDVGLGYYLFIPWYYPVDQTTLPSPVKLRQLQNTLNDEHQRIQYFPSGIPQGKFTRYDRIFQLTILGSQLANRHPELLKRGQKGKVHDAFKRYFNINDTEFGSMRRHLNQVKTQRNTLGLTYP